MKAAGGVSVVGIKLLQYNCLRYTPKRVRNHAYDSIEFSFLAIGLLLLGHTVYKHLSF